MIKISERDSLEEQLRDTADSTFSSEVWEVFQKNLSSAIDDTFEKYIESEFNKTSIATAKRNAEAGWDYFKSQNSLTPYKEQQISDALSKLQEEEDFFKNDLRDKLMPLKTKTIRESLNQRI